MQSRKLKTGEIGKVHKVWVRRIFFKIEENLRRITNRRQDTAEIRTVIQWIDKHPLRYQFPEFLRFDQNQNNPYPIYPLSLSLSLLPHTPYLLLSAALLLLPPGGINLKCGSNISTLYGPCLLVVGPAQEQLSVSPVSAAASVTLVTSTTRIRFFVLV